MTLLTAVRPYHRLSDVLREDVDAALTGFRAYLAMMRPKLCVKAHEEEKLLRSLVLMHTGYSDV